MNLARYLCKAATSGSTNPVARLRPRHLRYEGRNQWRAERKRARRLVGLGLRGPCGLGDWPRRGLQGRALPRRGRIKRTLRPVGNRGYPALLPTRLGWVADGLGRSHEKNHRATRPSLQYPPNGARVQRKALSTRPKPL